MGGTVRMGGRSALLGLGLLALWCGLLPRPGEGTAGVALLDQAVDGTKTEVLHGEEAQDEPGEEDELTETQAGKVKRATEEDALPARFRRVPEEEGRETKKKDKKDRKEKKNRDPKEPKATKKPKAEKKQKEKGGRRGKEKEPRLEAPTTTTTTAPTTTTPPPTTTELYTEPAPTEADPYPDYPDSEDDYWKLDEEEQPTTAESEPEDDYWTTEEEEPASPVVDQYDDYWKSEEPTTPPSSPTVYKEVDLEDDYYEGKYDDPDNVPLPDGAEVVPTEKDDWSYDVTDMPENVPLPDVKEEVIPTEKDDWSYFVTEEPVTPPPTNESPWYDEYDYGHSGGQSKHEEERERQRKEREKEERERAQRRREEEERAKKRPRVFKEPKKCPPLGMETHKIESDQLLASSMSQYRYSQGRARLNMQDSDNEEDMNGGAWCPNPDDKIHWFEIDARKATEFTGIITQGRDSRNESDFVTSYYVQFSNDSREWKTIHDGYSDWLFFGNSDKDTPVLNQLAEPILARYIRIIPQSWNGSCCMRLEILGCPVPDPTSVYQRLKNEVRPVQYLEFRHHNYATMVTLMKSVTEECPNITSMYSLGRSNKGLDILAMVISGNPTEHEIGEPEFRYTAGLHGNEATGREMVLLLMQYLCKEYKDGNPRVHRLVEGIRIHLVPSLNPDGQEKALAVGSELSDWTTGHWTEDGYDIFQNFPDLTSVLWEAEDKNFVPKVTPNHHVKIPEVQDGDEKMAMETQAIISWMESHPFVLGANFQGGERVVAYPYDSHRLTKTLITNTIERERAHSRKKRQYEEEYERQTEWDGGYDRQESEEEDRYQQPEEERWNQGYQEPEQERWNQGYQEPEQERWNRGYQAPEQERGNRGYQEPEQERWNRGYQEPEEERWNRGYQEPEEERWNRGYQEPEEERWNRGYQEPEEERWNRGYQEPEQEHWNQGYPQPEEEWRGHGYGHREEEEEDDRGRGGAGEAEPEDEPRVTADASFFRWLAISYASTHLSMTYTSHGSCHSADISGGVGIVNRAKWKPVKGSMNDFSYLHTNCLELSVFLGCDKFPHESELVIEWEKNREAMLTFMEQVHRGIRGVVKDKDGRPISNATVSVEGINHDVTTAITGDYWRLLNPGEYRVTVRAEGFSPLTKLCVVGYEPGATTCSFNLAKSNWDRIKQIMALHGNKPIRLLSHGNVRTRQNTVSSINRRVVHTGVTAVDPMARRIRLRKLRLARLRRLRQQKLITTFPPTTTTQAPTTTKVEPTTSWYDSWFIGEGQTSAPEGFTDSISDYNYEYKIDDY